ncbi:MAG: SRPBCC family protein, partial [Alphaproteobacteria bacterium]
VTFDDVAGKTRITLRAVFPTAAARERVVREYGAKEGAEQTVARLAGYVGELAAGGENGVGRVLLLTRVFDAPRELVFKCWTDPKHFAAWWGPHMFTAPKVELDLRPGGKIFVLMSGPPPWQRHPMGGEFREISPPERLVFTSHLEAGGRLTLQNLNSVTFEDLGGKTRMRLHVRVLVAAPEMAGALGGMEIGWSQSLEKLAAYVVKL